MDLSNPPGDARNAVDGDPPLPAATWQGTPGHLFHRSSFAEIPPSRRLMYIGPGDPAIVYPAGQIRSVAHRSRAPGPISSTPRIRLRGRSPKSGSNFQILPGPSLKPLRDPRRHDAPAAPPRDPPDEPRWPVGQVSVRRDPLEKRHHLQPPDLLFVIFF